VNILYLIFNRPHLQVESFESIRRAKPAKLFIAADGPRDFRDDDQKKCEQARRIVDQVNWKCEVNTLFRETNVGCRRAVGDAITWFFRNVEDGIVIEDDCIASSSFFQFAEELLKYYRDDERVWCISGSNFQNGVKRGDGSYYFSRYNHCWGWASWRRCWVHYDDSLTLWKRAETLDIASDCFENILERDYWKSLWNGLLSPDCVIDSWAYRWSCSVVLNGGLTALPNANLVTNIGFAEDGSHCFGSSPDPGIQQFDCKLVHPSFVIRDREADRLTFETVFGGRPPTRLENVKRRIRRFLPWMRPFRQL
jgi:hypothetical protein